MIFQTFLQSKKWQHKDPQVRLEAIAELQHALDPHDKGTIEAEKILANIATKDENASVRRAAISHVHTVEVLQALQNDADTEIQNAALMQYCRVVSGAARSALTPAERIALMQGMDTRQLLLAVLHDCGCDETGLATLQRLQSEFAIEEDALVDIGAHSNNHTVRHAAALQIESLQALEQLAALVRQKDKTVFKLCKDKLQVIHDAEAKRSADAAMAVQICHDIDALAHKVIGALSQAQYEYKLSQWQEVKEQADSALLERFDAACKALELKLQEHASAQQMEALQSKNFADLASACEASEAALTSLTAPLGQEQIDLLEQQHHALEALRSDTSATQEGAEAVFARAQALITQLALAIRAFHALEAKRGDLLQFHESLQTLTAKNTVGVNKARHRFQKLFHKQAWPSTLPASELYGQCVEMETLLERLVTKNRAYLDKLHKDSLAHVAALEQHVEAGQVNEAQRMWDKVQGAIKNADEELKKVLHDLLVPFKPRINELVDWKNFAAAEKKKELIAHMHALIDNTMHAADKSKRIKALQEEWKKLGHSVQNDALWAQFNEAAHKAFEPCKEYFKERKAKLHSNFDERSKICTQLEELVGTLTEDTLNIASVNKIESKAIEDWKLYAPVEQAKIKKLQKRFNTVLTDLRQFKRKVLQNNAVKKLELIAQAEALDALEDVQEAMNEAKKLQAQWKTIGPSPYKDDRNHWNAFRAACDKIFSKRKAEAPVKPERGASKARGASASPAVAAAREVLHKLNQLIAASSEELVNSRREFNELKDSFLEHLKADIKHERRALQEQFDKLHRLYENKLKAAPDKKSLQLIGQAKTKAEFLEKLERVVLTGKGEPADMDAMSEEWQGLGRVADLEQEQALEERFQAIYRGVDKAILKKEAKNNEQKATELCISAEILAGLDSPDADRALRMQVQLKQLKNSFGSRGNKSPAQQLSEIEMQLVCLGPLDANVRKACGERLEKARTKL
jgi:exonuclease SbcC